MPLASAVSAGNDLLSSEELNFFMAQIQHDAGNTEFFVHAFTASQFLQIRWLHIRDEGFPHHQIGRLLYLMEML